MTRQKPTFLCTRPRLAQILQSAGIHYESSVNPFCEGEYSRAWYFDLTETSVKLITEFYSGIGKPVPKSVQNWVEGGAAE